MCFVNLIYLHPKVSGHKILGMIKITLPDGSVKEFAKGTTPMDVAKSISEGLARNVISAAFNGTTVETETPLTTDGSLILYTWNDKEGKKAFWHSTSHVMAQVLEEQFLGIKLTLGPAIDNGFYYDVDFGDQKITDADFKKVEDRVLEVSREKHEFKMRPVSKAEALEIYKNNEYKFWTTTSSCSWRFASSFGNEWGSC